MFQGIKCACGGITNPMPMDIELIGLVCIDAADHSPLQVISYDCDHCGMHLCNILAVVDH